MLMIAPFAAFLQEFSEVEEKYISNIICICSFANAIVCTVLHMTGICEFKNTVFCTHFLMACDLLYLLYVIWQRYRVRGMDRRVCVCIWGLVILLLSYAVDMSAYYIGWRRTDVIGRFGFLLFICLLAREATAVSIEKIDEGRKAEIYRELAEHDMPTGLRNRNAYDEWVSENARDRETAIVTFDLNDLKRCNDTFGHAAGDKYIQDAAKLISEVFEPAGVCYRIGGDEFCAVIRHARSEWVEECNVTKLSQNTPLHSKLSCNGALFCVFSKKHLTNMQFRAAILLSTLSKMALVVRSVSRHKNYKEDYL